MSMSAASSQEELLRINHMDSNGDHVPDRLTLWQKFHKWRKGRTRQDKATAASWRAIDIYAPAAISTYYTYTLYKQGTDFENLIVWAGVTLILYALAAPFALWWSISALRRGTRRFLLSLVTGFVSGVLVVFLLAGIVAAFLGFSLLTGEQPPLVDPDLILPEGLR